MTGPLPRVKPFEAPIAAIGFDADDTLWHNEDSFHAAEVALVSLLAPWADESMVRTKLLEVERENLTLFGYGVKPFTLSMIEAAIEISGSLVPANTLHELLEHGKTILRRPTELLPHVSEVVADLAGRYPLLLITKGDLHHQMRKIEESGLAVHFTGVHVVAEKDPATYERILRQHAFNPAEFVMVGNSVRSDLLPVLALGGRGVHVPYHVTWAHEVANVGESVVPVIQSMAQLLELIP